MLVQNKLNDLLVVFKEEVINIEDNDRPICKV